MSTDNKKNEKIFLLIIVIVFISIIFANFHIVLDTPKTFVKRMYLGFEDPIASINECTDAPYFIVMSEHQSLCKALQREGYLESDADREDRISQEIDQEVEDTVEKWDLGSSPSESKSDVSKNEEADQLERDVKNDIGEESEYEPDSGASNDEGSEDNLTSGEKNALRSAQNYLNTMGFSREELIQQLKYEEYTHEEAVYAVDNSGADWHEEAAESAQEYLDQTSFSREGLIEQLEYEGFTKEQAESGAEAVGY